MNAMLRRIAAIVASTIFVIAVIAADVIRESLDEVVSTQGDGEDLISRIKRNGEGWGYGRKGETGLMPPNKWSEIPGDETCAGSRQSPIDIKTKESVKLPRSQLRFYNYKFYKVDNITVHNNGHTVNIEFGYNFDKVNIHQMPHITGGRLNDNYGLMSIHFHFGHDSSRGSEHTINGQHFPMEAHFYHVKQPYLKRVDLAVKDPEGISVLAVFFSIQGSQNKNLNKLLNNIRQVRYLEQKVPMKPFNIYELLPKRYDILYTYKGSLTTPPCAEAVIWNVLFGKVFLSEYQMGAFRRLQRETSDNDPSNDQPIADNYRDRQQQNGRIVYNVLQF